jgi:antitoxin YefM
VLLSSYSEYLVLTCTTFCTKNNYSRWEIDMDVMTYSDARAQLKGVMDRAIVDGQEVVVTRKKGEAVVVVSLDAWNEINETLHLLSTPVNAARLRSSIAELDAAGGQERELEE